MGPPRGSSPRGKMRLSFVVFKFATAGLCRKKDLERSPSARSVEWPFYRFETSLRIRRSLPGGLPSPAPPFTGLRPLCAGAVYPQTPVSRDCPQRSSLSQSCRADPVTNTCLQAPLIQPLMHPFKPH